jgi:hypothetical protein
LAALGDSRRFPLGACLLISRFLTYQPGVAIVAMCQKRHMRRSK